MQPSRTRNGTILKHRWDCPPPKPDTIAAGYPILTHAEHTCIYQATWETGAYNHHSQLCRYHNRFYAMWSNHPYGEDGPGQRVLYSISDDGTTWEQWQELFVAPGPVKRSEETGLACTALRWLILDDQLYAVAALHRNIGFTDHNTTRPPVAIRDAHHPARAREGYAPLARILGQDGTLEPVFSTGAKIAEDVNYDLVPDPTEGRLRQAYHQPQYLPSWDFEGTLNYPRAIEDGHRLCEPTVYQDQNGQWVMLLRDLAYSHRIYISYLDETKGVWSPAYPTNIPDSPSLSCVVRLNGGIVLLIGNQIAPEFDNWNEYTHYNRDPLTVSVSLVGTIFSRCYALRCGTQQFRIPQTEVLGRGGGGQYPSALTHASKLYVLYSMGKEDIWISSVILQDLEIDFGEHRDD